MKGRDDILLLCDSEEEYVQLFAEFVRRHREYPWVPRVYTDVQELLEQESGTEAALLLVAEHIYREELEAIGTGKTVILNESGVLHWDNLTNINKYQSADMVLQELLEVYLEIPAEQAPILPGRAHGGQGTGLIGIYSPVRRCSQTSFALAMSQLLATKHPTLYLNFEFYVGCPELLPDNQTRDLADLLYFLSAEKEQFRLRMQTMVQQRDGLTFIPPMKAGQNLLTVTGDEWLSLLQKIVRLGKYKYVVLDLSESMQGLFDILRMCDRVYTLTAEDKVARCKLQQYEQALKIYEYDDVLAKTRKCMLPKLRRVPEELLQYSRGDLAAYVERELEGWQEEIK